MTDCISMSNSLSEVKSELNSNWCISTNLWHLSPKARIDQWIPCHPNRQTAQLSTDKLILISECRIKTKLQQLCLHITVKSTVFDKYPSTQVFMILTGSPDWIHPKLRAKPNLTILDLCGKHWSLVDNASLVPLAQKFATFKYCI